MNQTTAPNQPPKLILFPGLGADEALFEPLRETMPEILVPEWIPPREGESLSEYAGRWVAALPNEEDWVVGGMSFGGQLALEIARQTSSRKAMKKPLAVLLISSHRSGSEISPQFRLREKLSRVLPDVVLKQTIQTLGVAHFARSQDLSPKHTELLSGMSGRLNLDFFRWSSRAVSEWTYEFQAKDFSMPIFQIHGAQDEVIQIPFDLYREDLTVLPEAKHLITFNHPEEVNQWIQNCLTAVS